MVREEGSFYPQEQAYRTPLGDFTFEKAGSWAFHNSSQESQGSGMKINSLINRPF
jgi:hypothetical protein